jgi:hypothetical protein
MRARLGPVSTGERDRLPIFRALVIVDPSNSLRLYVGTDLVFCDSDGEQTGPRTPVCQRSDGMAGDKRFGGGPKRLCITHGRGAWRVPLCVFLVSQRRCSLRQTVALRVDGSPEWMQLVRQHKEDWVTIVSAESGSGNGSVGIELRELHRLRVLGPHIAGHGWQCRRGLETTAVLALRRRFKRSRQPAVLAA